MVRPRVLLAMNADLPPRLLDAAGWRRLRGVAEVADRVLTRADDPALADELGRAEVLLTSWGAPPVDAALLHRAPRLRAVVHAAGSVKHLATAEAWERGIRFSTAAAANSVPVAEYTLAMILLAGKRVFEAGDFLRRTQSMDWPANGPLGNAGSVIGIVGASRIGRRVIELLRPFDLQVLLADPTIDAPEAASLGVDLVPLDHLLARATVVSLHAPLLPSTAGMIGARQLALMIDGATIINTARGGLLDTDALLAELQSGRLRAVLDVVDPEPLPAGHPLFDAPGLVLTPHVAGAMGSELRRLGAHAVDEIARLAIGSALIDEVLPERLEGIA